MTTFVVLATGPSMSQQLADYVRGKCGVIAISNAYTLAPWADALVSNDFSWWRFHREATGFAGRKFCGTSFPGTERLRQTPAYPSSCNSGLQGMRVASEVFKASRMLLLGFDMHGTHYFGRHPAPLVNADEARFRKHLAQFDNWAGCDVINCTPGSALKRFPTSTIERELESIYDDATV